MIFPATYPVLDFFSIFAYKTISTGATILTYPTAPTMIIIA